VPIPKQLTIPGLRDAMKKTVTRREQFLAEMDVVDPWGPLSVRKVVVLSEAGIVC
jgi:hypothetical protein